MAHNFDADRRDGGFVDTSLKPAPKRIIVCCDGTWQSSVTNTVNVPSNVTRLARYLSKTGKDDKGKEWQQVVYYDAGIGTGVGDLEAKRQGGTGSGFVGNVIEAYNFIVLNYNPGDKIFCVGFSRGAYTARAVAGLVTDIGVIRPRDMQDFPELYNLYQSHTDSHMFRQTKAWREWVEGKRLFDPKQKDVPKEWKSDSVAWEKRPHGAPAESTRWVEAVAVFDTVGSLGIPQVGVTGIISWLAGRAADVEKFGFHNVALSPYIKHAFHALALDEHRKPFDATLWHFPADDVATVPQVQPGDTSAKLREAWKKLRDSDAATEDQLHAAWEDLIAAEMHEELQGHRSELLQVWFPGVHINIGGGSSDLLGDKKSDFEQIAMITLMWMIEQLKPHLAFEINVGELASVDRFLLMRHVVDELITSNAKNHWLIKKINENIKNPATVTPDLWHDDKVTLQRVLAADALAGWATGPIIDSFTSQYYVAGSQYRKPGEYKTSKLQDGKPVKLGKTNEFIHPTVQYRIDRLKGEYEPVALKGFVRTKQTTTKKLDDGSVKDVVSYVWKKNGVEVPEYKIGGMSSVERSCVAGLASRAWLGHLDKEYGVDSLEARQLDAKPEATPQTNGFTRSSHM